MEAQAAREMVIIDLIGELDVAMSARLSSEIAAVEAANAMVVVRLERVESTQWAGLCELANAIAHHRRRGVDVRASARLRRIGAILDEYGIPGDVPLEGNFSTRRRLIIARTPKPRVA